MNSRWKKVWADFWGNKSRTALTVLTVFVGTFGVGFISNLQLYMIESMDGDYLSASPAEARIYAYPMDDDSVKIASEIPGVDVVEGRSITNLQVLRPDGENIAIQFTAVKNPSDLMINTLQPVKNESSIPPLRDREVLIDVSAISLGYQSGDLLTVELSNGRRRELRVAGYLHDATGVPYSQPNMITAFVTPNTIKWLGGNLDYNVLLISVAEQPNDYEHVTKMFEEVGAKTIVTNCPGCFMTFSEKYARYLKKDTKDLPYVVKHSTVYIDELMQQGKLKFRKNLNMRVTYQDPCHLARRGEPYKHWEGKRIQWGLTDPPRELNRGVNGNYEPPRNIIKAIPGVTLVEMERIKEYAWCCGSGAGS